MNTPRENTVDQVVREKVRALGFDAVGIARADVPLDVDFDRYLDFVANEMHGEMKWLAENIEVRRRTDTDRMLGGAKSVICVARRYQRGARDEANDPPTARAIARYARGRDYHGGVRKKLRKLAAFLRTLGTDDAPVEARPLCDDAPILERAWAARSGLGFVGKNGLVIVPGQGSFVLLGEVLTTLRLAPDTPMNERCGSCTRCIDACPTNAFVKPFVLDPRKCIAYLTIEHRSAVPVGLRDAIGEHFFGCDDCQTVCPFNASSRVRDESTTRPFEPHARWAENDLASFVTMTREAWGQIASGSPIKRAHFEGTARNAAIALGNAGDASSLPRLREAAEGHESLMVRDAASWAIGKIVRAVTASAKVDEVAEK